jgi:hypothetical protein
MLERVANFRGVGAQLLRPGMLWRTGDLSVATPADVSAKAFSTDSLLRLGCLTADGSYATLRYCVRCTHTHARARAHTQVLKISQRGVRTLLDLRSNLSEYEVAALQRPGKTHTHTHTQPCSTAQHSTHHTSRRGSRAQPTPHTVWRHGALRWAGGVLGCVLGWVVH